MNLNNMDVKELLCLQASVIDELQRRKIVRTKNNPLGDYTEWLVANALDLELQSNSRAGYDGVSKSGVRVQIKGRRITTASKSRQLGAIRNYEENDFDELAAVIFDDCYEVVEALLIPHHVIGKYAAYRSHVNAHVLILSGPIINDQQVRSIKHLLCK